MHKVPGPIPPRPEKTIKSRVAKKAEQYWFKSDQRLTNITNHHRFYIDKVWASGWWNRVHEYRLYGRVIFREAKWVSAQYTWQSPYWQCERAKDYLLGQYETELAASVALEEIMDIRGIKTINRNEGH